MILLVLIVVMAIALAIKLAVEKPNNIPQKRLRKFQKQYLNNQHEKSDNIGLQEVLKKRRLII